MKYSDFEYALSRPRTRRYLDACGGNKRKAMTLYRLNIQLSHELFSMVSVLEIALRNAYDYEMRKNFGNNWLIDALQSSGRLRINASTHRTYEIIQHALLSLDSTKRTQDNLIPNLEFGVWHYMFARPQNAAFGHKGINIFYILKASKPTLTIQDIFNFLTDVNNLRNRLAHHEPVCFLSNCSIKDTSYARDTYALLINLISGMGLNAQKMLYGIDHVIKLCNRIDSL